MASVSALLQNATLASWMPDLQSLAAAQPLPLLTGLLVGYLPWVVGAGLVMSLATMASALGLAMRLEWARRCFIGLLALAIAANLLGLWLQHEVVQSVVQATLAIAPLPPAAANVFGGFVTAAQVMALAGTLVACAFLAWVIRRLMSPAVRQEFA
jgi:Sec-independent protein secretion pathway component TatC